MSTPIKINPRVYTKEQLFGFIDQADEDIQMLFTEEIRSSKDMLDAKFDEISFELCLDDLTKAKIIRFIERYYNGSIKLNTRMTKAELIDVVRQYNVEPIIVVEEHKEEEIVTIDTLEDQLVHLCEIREYDTIVEIMKYCMLSKNKVMMKAFAIKGLAIIRRELYDVDTLIDKFDMHGCGNLIPWFTGVYRK